MGATRTSSVPGRSWKRCPDAPERVNDSEPPTVCIDRAGCRGEEGLAWSADRAAVLDSVSDRGDAIVRNLEVIGEAARKVLIHEYFGVELPILWKTVRIDLPANVPALTPIIERP